MGIRAALIGRQHQRADTEWLAEVLIEQEEDDLARRVVLGPAVSLGPNRTVTNGS